MVLTIWTGCLLFQKRLKIGLVMMKVKWKTSLKKAPYNRGLLNYQNAKSLKGQDVLEYDVNQVSEKTDDVDTEVLTKSIHEQSDSVRQWIEKSEPAVVAFRENQQAQVLDRESLVSSVMDMIEEPINDRQARIILGLAQYDLEKVRKCYHVAQNTQVADKIDMLIHELQKKKHQKHQNVSLRRAKWII